MFRHIINACAMLLCAAAGAQAPMSVDLKFPTHYSPGGTVHCTFAVELLDEEALVTAMGIIMHLPADWKVVRDPLDYCAPAVVSAPEEAGYCPDFSIRYSNITFTSPGVCSPLPLTDDDLEMFWIFNDCSGSPVEPRFPVVIELELQVPEQEANLTVDVSMELLYRIGPGVEQRANDIASGVVNMALDGVADYVLTHYDTLALEGGPIFLGLINGETPYDAEVLEAVDANGDSLLTRDEMQAIGKQRQQHTMDQDGNNAMELDELLRVVQLFNAGYHCEATGEDGFATGAGSHDCLAHSTDYAAPYFEITLSELLRSVQLFNVGSYTKCVNPAEDGFCAGE